MNRPDEAKILFEGGCNCCQAVFCAFLDETNMTKEDALRLSAGFGGGFGRLREVCGAVSGMFMVAGLKRGYTSPDDMESKKEHYKFIQHLANEFKKDNLSIICRDLLEIDSGADNPTPEPRTNDYYKKRPCGELVYLAAEIVGKRLMEL